MMDADSSSLKSAVLPGDSPERSKGDPPTNLKITKNPFKYTEIFQYRLTLIKGFEMKGGQDNLQCKVSSAGHH